MWGKNYIDVKLVIPYQYDPLWGIFFTEISDFLQKCLIFLLDIFNQNDTTNNTPGESNAWLVCSSIYENPFDGESNDWSAFDADCWESKM